LTRQIWSTKRLRTKTTMSRIPSELGQESGVKASQPEHRPGKKSGEEAQTVAVTLALAPKPKPTLENKAKPKLEDEPTKPKLEDEPTKPELEDEPTKPELEDEPTKPKLEDEPAKPKLEDDEPKPKLEAEPMPLCPAPNLGSDDESWLLSPKRDDVMPPPKKAATSEDVPGPLTPTKDRVQDDLAWLADTPMRGDDKANIDNEAHGKKTKKKDKKDKKDKKEKRGKKEKQSSHKKEDRKKHKKADVEKKVHDDADCPDAKRSKTAKKDPKDIDWTRPGLPPFEVVLGDTKIRPMQFYLNFAVGEYKPALNRRKDFINLGAAEREHIRELTAVYNGLIKRRRRPARQNGLIKG